MKKITVKKSRKWLDNNKVFFEIFSFVFLGLASLFVAYFSYKSSDSQLEILRLEHSPIINIQREFNGNYEFLKINNVGYHLFEPNTNYSSYFIIKNYNDSIIKSETDFYFKTIDYFGLNYETGNTTGNIATISTSPYTYQDSKRIVGECRDLFGDNFQVGVFEHLLRITFSDESKNRRTKYFKVDSFSIIEISKKIYDETKKKYDSHNLTGHKYLNTITSSEILTDIKSIYEKVVIFDKIKDADI